jgi:hypothetical protein
VQLLMLVLLLQCVDGQASHINSSLHDMQQLL